MNSTVTIKAGYEKVTCRRCNGSGRVPMGQGYYSWKSDRRRKPNCPDCGGYGFNAVRSTAALATIDASTKGDGNGR